MQARHVVIVILAVLVGQWIDRNLTGPIVVKALAKTA